MSQINEQDFETTSNINMIKRIGQMLIPYKKLVFLLFLINIIISIVDITLPWMNKWAIDTLVEPSVSNNQIILFALQYFVLICIQVVCIYGFFYVVGKIEMSLSYDLRKACVDKLQQLPFSYYDKTPIGWLLARITGDVTKLCETVSWGLLDISWCFIVMVGVSIVMLIVNWQMALLVLVVVPILAVVSVWFQVRILKSYRVVRKQNSKITASFNEGISGLRTSKTLVLEEAHYQDFKIETRQMQKYSIRSATLSAVYLPVAVGLGSIAIAALLVVGGQQTLVGSIQFGTLLLFSQYATMFFEPIRQVARLIADFQLAKASGERIVSLLDKEVELVDSKDVIEKYGSLYNQDELIDPIRGDVEFKNIDFYYNEKEPILQNFNLKIKAGTSVALVGETGSGKTSIVNLLCRFYEPKSGELLLDGVDYRKRSISWLHRQIGYVLQDPHLFSGTIEQNLLIASKNKDVEEMINVCKMVHIHEFIVSLQDGYQTQVGQDGANLSVGQKQLLSIARAVLSNPSFFILDEATASIDTETEKSVQDAIKNVLNKKTSFIIAHRLSTIVDVDLILVIQKGKIIESGNHNKLMNKKGNYYRLYTNQFYEDKNIEVLSNK